MRRFAVWIVLLGLALPAGAARSASHGCDFDGDGLDDLVTTNAAGTATRIWTQLAAGATSPISGTIPSGGWELAGCGDLDGDGQDDLVYDGANAIRIDLMDGVAVTARGWIGNGAGSYGVVAIGDMDGDDRDDLLLQSTTGWIRIDLMNGVSSVDRGWPTGRFVGGIIGAGDLNGDGMADFAVLTGTHNCCIVPWLVNGIEASQVQSVSAGTLWIADVDLSGSQAMVIERVQRVPFGSQQIETGIHAATWSRTLQFDPWRLQTMADLDGDGRADFVSAAEEAPGFVRLALVAAGIESGAEPALSDIGWIGNGGGAFELRQTGDFDGDGKTDLAYQGPCSVRIDRMDGVTLASRSHLASGCDWALPALR